MKTTVSLLLGLTLLTLVAPSRVESALVRAPLFAVLAGGNEVDENGVAGAGDADGRGSATILVEPNTSKLCFGITVAGIGAPLAAHIHKEAAGKNGGIVVALTSPTTGNPGASSGCVTGVPKALLNSLLSAPGGFYVNVHTDDFQGGSIRGQLF